MIKGLKFFLLLLLLLITLLVILTYSYSKDIRIPETYDGKHITVKGMKLRVHQTGKGPDVLFIHGSIGSLEDFEAVLPMLKDFRVTSFDRIGHGFSEMPDTRADINSNAEYTSALIDTLGLKNVILVGHSYGGSIALQMAIDQDPNIKALVLLAPACQVAETNPVEHVFSQPVVGLGLLRLLRPFIAESMLSDGLLYSLHPNQGDVATGFVGHRVQLWNEPGILFTRTQQTSVVETELAEMSKQYQYIKYPTTILLGEQEGHKDIYEGSTKLAEQISDAKLRLIKYAGHYLQYKEPHTVAETIRSYKN